MTAVLWEFGEYVTFIRNSPELDTAYTDTLGSRARAGRLDRGGTGHGGIPAPQLTKLKEDVRGVVWSTDGATYFLGVSYGS